MKFKKSYPYIFILLVNLSMAQCNCDPKLKQPKALKEENASLEPSNPDDYLGKEQEHNDHQDENNLDGQIVPNHRAVELDFLQQQLETVQQSIREITKKREEAHQQQENTDASIQGRLTYINQLQQQKEELKKPYETAKYKRESSEATLIERQHFNQQVIQLNQQMQKLNNQIYKEIVQLKQDHQEQVRIQEQIKVNQAKHEKLEEIEEEVQERIRETEELEKEVQEAWDQELADSIGTDKETEALIQQLREEADLLRTNQAPQHLIDELEQLIQQEVSSLQANNQQTSNWSQANLQEKALKLQHAQSKREADLIRQVGVVERLAAIDKKAFEVAMSKWEAENQRKTAEEMKRLEEIRKEAEEDRLLALCRDKEDEENARRKKEREKNKFNKATS